MGIMTARKHNLTLEQRVLKYIQANRLVLPGQKVLLAVSGGADSVCLLHALCGLQAELEIALHIAHLNHQLRGEESEADADYVADLARKLKIPATIEKRDVTGYQAEHRLSLEEAAREVRYSFLAQTAQTVGAERVATGHTLNDQVETILLHIIRGTGTRGLRGLQACQALQFSGNRLTVVRPLLEIRREETEEYCSRLHLKPRQDTSNLSLSLTRNRVRRELLPRLLSYNPGIFESLLRLGRISHDELDFLEKESEKAWKKIVRKQGNSFIFEKREFKPLAPALQRQLLRRAIEGLLGTLKDVETRHVEGILGALKKPAGRRIALPEGLVFSIEYERYLLGFHPGELIPLPELEGAFDISIPGITRIPGWDIEASVIPREKMNELTGTEQPGIYSACFDSDRVGGEVKVRARERGDRFQPQGMAEEKKVGEFMLDARIPRLWRKRIPIVYTPQQIIWLAGWRIDERVKVTENTREVLCLKMVRVPDIDC